MTIKAWETIPKDINKPEGAYFTRIGDTPWVIDTYAHGFVVGKMRSRNKNGLVFLSDSATKYPKNLENLISTVADMGHVLEESGVKGLQEAVQGRIKAVKLAQELITKIGANYADTGQNQNAAA